MNDAIVVTGTGLICSLGRSPAEVWDGLLAGKSGIRPIESFDASGFACRVAATVQGADLPDSGIQPKLARMMDGHLSMLYTAARDALAMCGIGPGDMARDAIGFFAGMGMVDYEVEDLLRAVKKSIGSGRAIDYDLFYSRAYQEIYPLWPLAMLNNVAFCQVAISLDIRGENSVFSPHGDSGVQAIAEAMDCLLDGKADLVLAGGVSEKVSPLSLARAQSFGILHRPADGEEAVCSPFSARRAGTVLGEGSGVLAMERASSARARNAAPLAVISGCGFSCEREENAWAPTAKAVANAMKAALDRAGLKASDVGAVIGHGDGTVIGDANEMEAMRLVLGDALPGIEVFSSKGALGHMFAGSPLADAALAIQMLNAGAVPSTVNAQPRDAGGEFQLPSGGPSALEARRVLVNTSSYEGQCASLVVEAVDL